MADLWGEFNICSHWSLLIYSYNIYSHSVLRLARNYIGLTQQTWKKSGNCLDSLDAVLNCLITGSDQMMLCFSSIVKLATSTCLAKVSNFFLSYNQIRHHNLAGRRWHRPPQTQKNFQTRALIFVSQNTFFFTKINFLLAVWRRLKFME